MQLIFSAGFTKLSSRAYLTPEVATLRVYKKSHHHGPATAVNIRTNVLTSGDEGKTPRTPGTLSSPIVVSNCRQHASYIRHKRHNGEAVGSGINR